MGQKTNPIGFRVGYTKQWSSMWYATDHDYAKYVLQDFHIRKFLSSTIKARISNIAIFRSHNKITINLHCDKPGLVIGRKGSEIEKIRHALCTRLALKDITFNVLEEKKIDLNAQIVAQNIAVQIEKRSVHKRVMKKAIASSMKSGATGIKIKCGGRLGGAEIARSETLKEGSIPLTTIDAHISYGFAEAHTTYGIIGIKVWIYKE